MTPPASRTVTTAMSSGAVGGVVVDQVTGIAVNDTLHPSFSASGITTVTAINSGTKTLTFQGTIYRRH